MKFKNKTEFINFIKEQLNITLLNDKNDILNNKRKSFHVQIKLNDKYPVLNLLNHYNIRYESHLKDYYFIKL